jgi:hypothetical protein
MAEADFHQHAPHLTVTEARSGLRGRHVLIVLIISVSLAVIALAIAWAFREHDIKIVDAAMASRAQANQPISPPVVPTRPLPSPGIAP